MTDRDRLAADLHTIGAYRDLDDDVNRLDYADRLIALGWTRKDSKDLTVDEERARIRAAVEGLNPQQDGDIVTLNGTHRRPVTPADYVELYRAAVLRIIDEKAAPAAEGQSTSSGAAEGA